MEKANEKGMKAQINEEREKVIQRDNLLFGSCFVLIVSIFMMLTFF